MSDGRILSWLNSAGLGHCVDNFSGIDERKFLNLSMADYADLRITSMLERKRLFSLIQNLRREGVKPESSSAALVETPLVAAAVQVSKVEKESKENKQPKDVPLIHPAKNEVSPSVVTRVDSSPLRKAPVDMRPPAAAEQERVVRITLESNNGAANLRSFDSPVYDGAIEEADLGQFLPQHAKQQRSRPPIPKNPPTQPQQTTPAPPVQVPVSATAVSSTPTSRGDRIRVTVRKRPMIRKETARGETDVIAVDSAHGITVLEPKTKVDLTKFVETHEFYFDGVFDEFVTNEQIYSRSCQPLVNYVFQQGKATCFAYGQTGAGKTFTMMGSSSSPGLYMLAAQDIFRTLPHFPQLCVWVSFYEIYGGKLFDLLNERKRLTPREDGARNVNICGLEERQVGSVEELIAAMDLGNAARSTASTGANDYSSRSHAILAITIRDKKDKRSNQSSCHGKFSFIDLAGSERASDTTDNDRQTRCGGWPYPVRRERF